MIAAMLQADRIQFVNAMFVDPNAIPDLISHIAMRLVSGITIATLLLVTADVVWSRMHWRQELRMSRQEIKEEAKQIEGDPLVKARMRSLALDRRRRNMIAAVSNATLVVANPDPLRDRAALRAGRRAARRASWPRARTTLRCGSARWPRSTIFPSSKTRLWQGPCTIVSKSTE